MWAMRSNIVDCGNFKIQTLQGILETQNQHQAEFCAFLEVEQLYRSVGCARSKRQCLHSSTESEIISLDAGLRMDGLPALDLWDMFIEVLRTTQRIPKPTQACTRVTGVETQITPRLNKCWIGMWIYRT